jgi:hypothetical protein
MRSLRFLPLVFVAGVDGFAMFIPYLLLIWMLAITLDRKSQPNAVPAAIT